MITPQKRDELLKAIVYLKNKKSVECRKVTMEDLMAIPKKKEYDDKNKNERINSFRKQEEFGPKKRIKPWRTSTKSQQQIVPRGHKKGFRGSSVNSTNFFKNQMKQNNSQL